MKNSLEVAADKVRQSPHRWLTAGLSALCLGLFAGAANVNAAPITVTNAGFEDPVLAVGAFLDTNPMPGWVKSGTGGRIFHPSNTLNVVEGVNNYQFIADGQVDQTLADVLKPGVYNLSVAVGDQGALDITIADYQVQLGVMQGTTFVVLAEDNNGLAPNQGFLTSTVSYTAVDGDANMGLPLAIRLIASNTVTAQPTPTDPPRKWVLFDNVQLDFVAKTDFYLKAQPYDKPLPNGTTVPMWGFTTCTDATFATCDVLDPNAAGPQINAFAGDPLTLHVQNTLTVPVSVVIPGQLGDNRPVKVADAKGRMRMQSMTHETAAGAIGTYTWNSLKSGTYLYQSGTQPSLQVPMGLYGALVVVDSALATGTSAYPGVGYDSDSVMLLSEVDPVQNARVSAASVGGVATEACTTLVDYNAGVGGYPCTIDYNPTYLLVNGSATQASQITDGSVAQTVLIRFLNAGLRTHTPAFAGVQLSLVAEDGNKYPGMPKIQDSALLTAGKTIDALVTAPAFAIDPTTGLATDGVTWALYDHMSSFKNEASVNGGAVANFNIGTPAAAAPVTVYATEDVYAVTEDTPLVATTVLANDAGLSAPVSVATQPNNGTLAMNADGTFTYTPNANFSGTDTFMYSAGGTDGQAHQGLVTLNVSFVNDAPVAAADAYSNTIGTAIQIDPAHGLLGNDSDADGDTLTVTQVGTLSGLLLNADGSFIYTGATSATFQYTATDGTLTSAPVTVTLTINNPANVNLTVQEFGTGNAITSYRWIVQEDTTYHLDLTTPEATPVLQQQALNLHKSSMPVVAQGCSNCVNQTGIFSTPFNQLALDPTKYYYVSVLPNDAVAFDPTGARVQGHTIGGAQILPGQTNVTVIVNPQEIPTAQIAVEVFQDTAPTNGAIDGGEPGLGGFTITLEDGGGRYGISAGIMFQDTYGNALINSIPCFGDTGDQPYLDVIPVGNRTANSSLIETCPDNDNNRALGRVGHALIKNLAPGKYGVIAVPPATEKTWVQTSTIEGTKIIDAWVKAGEPPYFNEFGLIGPHAFIGFTRPETTCISTDPTSTCQVKPLTPPAATYTISGQITALHDPKPPGPINSVNTDNINFFSATRFWVGLNQDAGIGPSIATIQAAEDGKFTIPGVPDGTYQVVVWDKYLDALISYFTVTVAGADVDMVTVNNATQGVPAWFTRSEHNVFLDDGCGAATTDPRYGNGIRDLCDDGVTLEAGLTEQAVNIRWRDGTVNQSFPTDSTGFVPFDEAFPFFSWQLYEIDYLRFKPTGVTVTVDAGGATLPGEFINPQIQNPALFTADNEACTDATCTSRTETGSAVLLQAFQSFPGQTLLFDWGKVPYQPGENGGIAGIVFYSSTRAENDPRLTVGEPWEPGIANVKVRLYSVVSRADGTEALSLLKEVETDSWDANPPKGCQGETDPTDPFVAQTLGGVASRCFDGFRGWNQSRPGVFDGGYAFNTIPDPANPAQEIPIPPGKYVVEVIPPEGYEQYKEEDVNVTMGDARTGDTTGTFAPVSVTLPSGALVLVLPDQAMVQATTLEPGIAQPPCVGQLHTVPAELSLFPGEAAPFAGSDRPLCNRKLVVLSDQGQSAADFHLFTTTPVAAQYTGLITDDLSLETNPASPMKGEKFAPAYMPFSLRDYNGTVVYRGLGDAFGRYNGLLPSTFSANIPMPSGYSPAMMQACLNDVGPTVNPRYFSACTTGQFMPGTNTYLDTPILPQAAFAGGYSPPDCAGDDASPVIAWVNSAGPGQLGTGPLVRAGGRLRIHSMGRGVAVPNPNYQGPLAPAPYNQPTITRDQDFGPGGARQGTVSLVSADGSTTTPLNVRSWNRNNIVVDAPATPMEGTLVVTRGDNGNSTTNAVTVTVTDSTTPEVPVRVPGDQPTIQAAIDAATPGQLILVDAGVYHERVIMWKPVRLQGVGVSTVIDALQTGTNDLQKWNAELAKHLPDPTNPNQNPDLLVDLLPGLLTVPEDGAGITVLGRANRCFSANPNVAHYCYRDNPSRIDGFTITNGANGGAILVHAHADNLEIANNWVTGNSGQFSGGIRIGQPLLPNVEQSVNNNGVINFSDRVNIHHNAVTLNGALNVEGVGGGISINSGSIRYTVANNFICGNYTAGDGAGIGHYGLSHAGTIKSNKILFNQAYNVGFTTNGGGIEIAGEAGNAALTLGTGAVTIDSNEIIGNNAGSGHGGGIRLQYVNGGEVATRPNPWPVRIINNMVTNNVASWSGAGISMFDAVNTIMVNNTVANNDTTATQGSLVIANNMSVEQPAGVVAQMNSLGLHDAVVAAGRVDAAGNPIFNADFADPRVMQNNIVWHNRAFHLGLSATGANVLQPELAPAAVGDCAAGAVYWDLAVLGNATAKLDARHTVLSSLTDHGVSYAGTANRAATDLGFANQYCNGARPLSTPGPIQVFLGTGEGGNFVDIRFGPLVNNGDYHLTSASIDALDNGASSGAAIVPDVDFEGDARPATATDRGADEFTP